MDNEVKDLVMNEEVVEAVEEIAKNDSGKVLKALGKAGIVAGVGYLTYRFAIKPIIKKVKASKEIESDIIDAAEIVESDVVETE